MTKLDLFKIMDKYNEKEKKVLSSKVFETIKLLSFVAIIVLGVFGILPLYFVILCSVFLVVSLIRFILNYKKEKDKEIDNFVKDLNKEEDMEYFKSVCENIAVSQMERTDDED